MPNKKLLWMMTFVACAAGTAAADGQFEAKWIAARAKAIADEAVLLVPEEYLEELD